MHFCPRQNRKKCRDENFCLNLLSSLIWDRPGRQTRITCGHDIAAEWSLADGIVGAAIMNLSHNWCVHQLETSTEMKRSGSSSWCQCNNELTERCFHKKRDVILRHITLHNSLVENYRVWNKAFSSLRTMSLNWNQHTEGIMKDH